MNDIGGTQVFISYSMSHDTAAMESLVAILEGVGVACWRARADIDGGDFADQIAAAIAGSDAVVLLLSEHSSQSKIVKGELHIATLEGLPVLPLSIDGTMPAGGLALYVGPSDVLQIDIPVSPADSGRVIFQLGALLAPGGEYPTLSASHPWRKRICADCARVRIVSAA